MARLSINSGFHVETRKVSTLTSRVAGVKDGWHRGEPLNTAGAKKVSELYAELSQVIALYGDLAQHDTAEFDKFAVNIEVRDREDAK